MRSFAYPSILRGARTVMSEHDAFDRVLAAVHAATLDETRWPATSALIDEACGLTGNGLMVGEGPTNDVRSSGAHRRIGPRGIRAPPNWAAWDSPRRSGRASSTPMHGLSVRYERPWGACANRPLIGR